MTEIAVTRAATQAGVDMYESWREAENEIGELRTELAMLREAHRRERDERERLEDIRLAYIDAMNSMTDLMNAAENRGQIEPGFYYGTYLPGLNEAVFALSGHGDDAYLDDELHNGTETL